jgi:citronellyl-CoA dehydrogenase
VADDYADRVASAVAAARSSPAGPTGRAVWSALGQAGVLADLYPAPGTVRVTTPDPARLRTLLTVLDATCGTGVVLGVCVQVATAVPVLLESPTGGTVREVADAALRGDVIVALGVTDAGASGSDLLNLTTSADIGPDLVRLDGGKRWITSAGHADETLVLARHRPGEGVTNFTWILIPAGADGFTTVAADTPYFAGSGLGHLTFRDVRLGRDRVVGRVGAGLMSFTRHVATERLAGALWALALLRRVLRETHRRLTAAPDRGRPPWSSPAVRERFGRCLLRYEQLAAVCERHGGGPAGVGPLAGMLLKAAAAEAVEDVLTGCAGLAGADGFAAGAVGEVRAEAAMFGVAGGTGALMQAGIADHAARILAGDPAPEVRPG